MAESSGITGRLRQHRESVYNTAASGNYWNIPFISANLGTIQNLVPNPTIGMGSDPQAPLRDVLDGKGDITVPVDARYFGLHLAALLGDPTTSHPLGYQHVFASGATGQPTPQSMEVAHLGLATPEYFMNTGVLYESMEISMARSGFVQAKFGVIGTQETPGTSTGAGTPANLVDATVKYFSHLTGVIKRNSTVLANILGGTLSFNSNLDVLSPVANNGLIGGASRQVASVMLKGMKARFNNMTLYNDASSSPIQIDWILSNGSSESITFTMPKINLPRVQVPLAGPGGVEISFDAMANGDASNKALTVTLLNDYDGTGYAP